MSKENDEIIKKAFYYHYSYEQLYHLIQYRNFIKADFPAFSQAIQIMKEFFSKDYWLSLTEIQKKTIILGNTYNCERSINLVDILLNDTFETLCDFLKKIEKNILFNKKAEKYFYECYQDIHMKTFFKVPIASFELEEANKKYTNIINNIYMEVI